MDIIIDEIKEYYSSIMSNRIKHDITILKESLERKYNIINQIFKDGKSTHRGRNIGEERMPEWSVFDTDVDPGINNKEENVCIIREVYDGYLYSHMYGTCDLSDEQFKLLHKILEIELKQKFSSLKYIRITTPPTTKVHKELMHYGRKITIYDYIFTDEVRNKITKFNKLYKLIQLNYDDYYLDKHQDPKKHAELLAIFGCSDGACSSQQQKTEATTFINEILQKHKLLHTYNNFWVNGPYYCDVLVDKLHKYLQQYYGINLKIYLEDDYDTKRDVCVCFEYII